MSSLTEEQRKRMEANRRKALEIRAARMNGAIQKFDNKFTKNLNTQAQSVTTYCNNKSNPDLGNKMFKGMKNSNNVKAIAKDNFYKSMSSSSIPSSSMGTKITGTFQLVSIDRFVVDAGYHAQMIEIFKTMKSKLYDPKTKKWTFNLSDHINLSTALAPLRPEVCLSAIPSAVLKAIENYKKCSLNIDLMKLDPLLLEAFMPFQRKGVCFGISRKGRVLIADDMGLGKTLQALGIAAYYKHEWPLLIVCPSSVRYSWANSVQRWVDVDMDEIAVVDTSKDSLYAKVVILSYDILSRRSKETLGIGFRVVIMDESHMLKNSKTARTKAALPIMKASKRIILLSGTPALSRPSELFSQIKGINDSIFTNYRDFGIRYCNGKQTTWGWDFTGSNNLDELQVILENTIMIRRLKTEVLEQLPAKQRMTVMLNPSAINTSSKGVSEAAEKFNSCRKSSEAHSALLQFFSESAHAKLNAVSEYIKDLITDGKKFLVYAHHHVMLNKIGDTCQEMKTRYIRIDGATPSESRQKLVDHFQSDCDTRVAVLSITAAGTGLTLTAAQLVVFAELYWNPGILVQAEDRVHRIGQEDCVLIQYLVARGTADDQLWPMIQEKLNVLNKVGLSKVNFSEARTTEQKSSKNEGMLKYLVKLDEGKLSEVMTLDEANSSDIVASEAKSTETSSEEVLDDDLIACFEDEESF